MHKIWVLWLAGLGLLAGGRVSALPTEHPLLPALVQKFQPQIMAAINQACRDSWCLLAYKFSFEGFQCTTDGHCQLRFQYGAASSRAPQPATGVLSPEESFVFARHAPIKYAAFAETWQAYHVVCDFQEYWQPSDIFMNIDRQVAFQELLSERLNGEIAECVAAVAFHRAPEAWD